MAGVGWFHACFVMQSYASKSDVGLRVGFDIFLLLTIKSNCPAFHSCLTILSIEDVETFGLHVLLSPESCGKYGMSPVRAKDLRVMR